MLNITIYFEDNSELLEFESYNKGYRSDVFININQIFYKLSFYDTIRIIQDFNSEYDAYGYYLPDANLILIKDITTQTIIETCLKLNEQGFFDRLGPSKEVYDTNKMSIIYSK